MLTLWVRLAWGAPAVTVGDDGFVTGTVQVGASPEEALIKLADPLWVAATDGSGTVITVVGADGACTVLDYTSPTVVGPIRYVIRQCPAERGVDFSLVEPGSMKAYAARWRVDPAASGAVVTYAVRVEPAVPMPRFMMNRTTAAGVTHMLTKIEAALRGPG